MHDSLAHQLDFLVLFQGIIVSYYNISYFVYHFACFLAWSSHTHLGPGQLDWFLVRYRYTIEMLRVSTTLANVAHLAWYLILIIYIVLLVEYSVQRRLHVTD